MGPGTPRPAFGFMQILRHGKVRLPQTRICVRGRGAAAANSLRGAPRRDERKRGRGLSADKAPGGFRRRDPWATCRYVGGPNVRDGLRIPRSQSDSDVRATPSDPHKVQKSPLFVKWDTF